MGTYAFFCAFAFITELTSPIAAEASRLRKLRHPHVVRLEGIFYEADGVAVAQLEWIGGGTLAQWLLAAPRRRFVCEY